MEQDSLLESFIDPSARVSKTAIIHAGVRIGSDVIVHDYVVIYPNTVIGNRVEIYDHCVLGKPPTSPGNVSRRFKKQYPPLRIGDETILCPGVILYQGTTIGRQCLLGDFCSIREECEIGDRCLLSRNVTINYNTRIGPRTKVMDGTHLTGNMIIEEDVFISILVSTTNDNTMGRSNYQEEHIRGPHIHRGVTIGAAAVLLPNIEIGENAIVGAGSVVTRAVPPRKVVMGIPAQVTKDVPPEQWR
jgi:acetyltransferase-like isoleucine patch superfamily enzyme